MCKVIREYLEESPRNVVLECSTTYGSEFLYMKLSKVFNMPIHVKDFVYENYCRIPDLALHITNDPLSTHIHACMNKNNRSGLICRTDIFKAQNILTIVASAWKWKGKDTSVIGMILGEIRHLMCYSIYASFDELKKFIRYFEPEKISLCMFRRHKEQSISFAK